MGDLNTTSLPGKVQSAPANFQGFDTNTVVTAETANKFVNDGYQFCVRYLGRTQMASFDLTTEEANTILNAGLALMAVQHVLAFGWTPSAALGTEYGANAAKFAQEIGFPAGVNIWLDLEGVASGTPSQLVIDYCNNWFVEVSKLGYAPGIYVGANCILNGSQLYTNLKFQHYWKSGSNVPDVVKRGYQMVQYDLDATVNGIGIDKDATQTDNLGGQVQWLKA